MRTPVLTHSPNPVLLRAASAFSCARTFRELRAIFLQQSNFLTLCGPIVARLATRHRMAAFEMIQIGSKEGRRRHGGG